MARAARMYAPRARAAAITPKKMSGRANDRTCILISEWRILILSAANAGKKEVAAMSRLFVDQLVEIRPSKYTGPQETDNCAGWIVEINSRGDEALVELKGTGKLWHIPTRNIVPAFKAND
jgi:hypothetical protein